MKNVLVSVLLEPRQKEFLQELHHSNYEKWGSQSNVIRIAINRLILYLRKEGTLREQILAEEIFDKAFDDDNILESKKRFY